MLLFFESDTFIETAKQALPKSEPAQAADFERSKSGSLRAGGFVVAGAFGSHAPSIRVGATQRNTRDFLREARSKPPFCKSVHVFVNPGNLTGACASSFTRRDCHVVLRLDRFQQCPLGNDTRFNVSPQRNQQFPGKRNDPNPSHSSARAAEPPLIPLRHRAGRLIAKPAPRQLHHDPTHMRVAGSCDPPIALRLTALIRCRHQPDEGAQLSRILDLLPRENLRR